MKKFFKCNTAFLSKEPRFLSTLLLASEKKRMTINLSQNHICIYLNLRLLFDNNCYSFCSRLSLPNRAKNF